MIVLGSGIGDEGVFVSEEFESELESESKAKSEFKAKLLIENSELGELISDNEFMVKVLLPSRQPIIDIARIKIMKNLNIQSSHFPSDNLATDPSSV